MFFNVTEVEVFKILHILGNLFLQFKYILRYYYNYVFSYPGRLIKLTR